MMRKTWVTRLTIIGVIIFIVTGCSSTKSSNDESNQISLRLNWTVSGEHAPFYVAKEKGYYDDEGLNVEISEGDGSSTTLKLAANQQYDLGYADAATYAKGVAKGLPVKMIANYQQRNPMAVIFKPEQNIEEPDDLINNSVALTPGDSLTQVFPALLKANDISEDEVEEVSIKEPSAKETAMLKGKVDSFTAYYHDHIPRMEAQQDEKFDYIKYEDFGIKMLNGGLFSNEKALDEKSDSIKKFIEATNKAWKYTEENPEDAANLLSEQSESRSKDVILEEIKMMIPNTHTKNTKSKPYGWMSKKDWKASIDLLQKYADMDGSDNPEDYYTNEYIKK